MKYLFVIMLILLCIGLARAETLSWDPVEGATSYDVFVRDQGHSTWRPVAAGVSETQVDITPAVLNHTYEYSVVAVNECGVRAEYSDVVAYNKCRNTTVQKVGGVKITLTVEANAP